MIIRKEIVKRARMVEPSLTERRVGKVDGEVRGLLCGGGGCLEGMIANLLSGTELGRGWGWGSGISMTVTLDISDDLELRGGVGRGLLRDG